MLGSADLIEGTDQCVVLLRWERNVDINGGVGRRVTEGFPVAVGRDRISGMLNTYVIPTWYERRCEVREGHGGERRERNEPVVVHD